MAEKSYYDVLINWLKGAHTVETTLVNMLENQADRATEFPELRSHLQGHREASQRHAEMVRQCIEQLGGDVSELRTSVSKLFGEAQSRFLGVYGDSVVRDAIVGSVVEQVEISSYNAIIALAERLGENGVVDTCSEILEDEQRMLDYFNENLEDIVNDAYDADRLTKD